MKNYLFSWHGKFRQNDLFFFKSSLNSNIGNCSSKHMSWESKQQICCIFILLKTFLNLFQKDLEHPGSNFIFHLQNCIYIFVYTIHRCTEIGYFGPCIMCTKLAHEHSINQCRIRYKKWLSLTLMWLRLKIICWWDPNLKCQGMHEE